MIMLGVWGEEILKILTIVAQLLIMIPYGLMQCHLALCPQQIVAMKDDNNIFDYTMDA